MYTNFLKITIQLDYGIVFTSKIKIRNGILEILNHRNSRNFEFYLIFLFNFLQIKNIIGLIKNFNY